MKVIVIGAGIAGLGAATYFSRKGHKVRVLEASDRIGGRAITLRRKGSEDRVDVGTQYYHSSYTRALSLIRDVGLESTLSKIKGDSRFFDDRVAGGSYLLDHRLPWFRPAGIGGNLRLGWFLLSRLLRHPMSTFALEPQAKTDQLSGLALSENPVLREFLVRPLTLAGAIAEPEAMNVSLLHVLRLIRIILLTDYISLSGGIASLHERLGERLDIRLDSPVARLVEERGRITGVEVGGAGEILTADHVVIATTAPAALRFVPAEWDAEREFLASVTIPPFAFPTFFLDRPLEKNVWSYVTRRGSGEKVGIIIDAAQKNPSMVPSGKAVIQAWPCYPESKDFVDAPDSAIIDACRRELEGHFPGFGSWIEEAHVTRHAYAVPFHPVGHQTRAIEFIRNADRRGVSFCGDYLSGGYLEPALWSAERAANLHA
ncbi:MAG: FAD-dependent oxidoreductase [Deltaproteobacteria bacterium]|nr:FAD-dependent oxidoreductase [Deltaproteobacteria bacterium]